LSNSAEIVKHPNETFQIGNKTLPGDYTHIIVNDKGTHSIALTKDGYVLAARLEGGEPAGEFTKLCVVPEQTKRLEGGRILNIGFPYEAIEEVKAITQGNGHHMLLIQHK